MTKPTIATVRSRLIEKYPSRTRVEIELVLTHHVTTDVIRQAQSRNADVDYAVAQVAQYFNWDDEPWAQDSP
jgi:hypothetical protein